LIVMAFFFYQLRKASREDNKVATNPLMLLFFVNVFH
jgi:hypothetical protein